MDWNDSPPDPTLVRRSPAAEYAQHTEKRFNRLKMTPAAWPEPSTAVRSRKARHHPYQKALVSHGQSGNLDVKRQTTWGMPAKKLDKNHVVTVAETPAVSANREDRAGDVFG